MMMSSRYIQRGLPPRRAAAHHRRHGRAVQLMWGRAAAIADSDQRSYTLVVGGFPRAADLRRGARRTVDSAFGLRTMQARALYFVRPRLKPLECSSSHCCPQTTKTCKKTACSFLNSFANSENLELPRLRQVWY